MSAYIIANVTVTNQVQYDAYRAMASLAMQVHDAHVCVRGGATTLLEGSWPAKRVVVLKFPSVEHARAFYDSIEYSKARKLREGAAEMNMIVVEGAD